MDKVVIFMKSDFDKRAMYAALEIKESNEYSCSELYSIEPKGLGTSLVESLTCYIMRLSQMHCLPITSLLQLFKPFLSENYFELLLIKRNFNSTFYIISSNHIAKEFINASEVLTGINDLGKLTLISWSDIIKGDQLLKEKRSWCPICFNEMSRKGDIYELLIWNLKCISICPTHHIPLEQHCPDCNYKGNLIPHFAKLGYCSKCKKFLGKYSETTLKNNGFDLEWEV
jgi:hypothetical protein